MAAFIRANEQDWGALLSVTELTEIAIEASNSSKAHIYGYGVIASFIEADGRCFIKGFSGRSEALKYFEINSIDTSKFVIVDRFSSSIIY